MGTHQREEGGNDWFERLTGFREEDDESTQRRLQVEATALMNTITGQSFAMGRLEVVSLAELREHASFQPKGPACCAAISVGCTWRISRGVP